MKIHYGFDSIEHIANPVVTVGSFDGVHHGHRMLVDYLSQLAKECDGESVVITFDPHPRQVIKGETRLLSTLSEKLILLAQTPVDHVIVVNFTVEFSKISHAVFVDEYLLGKLGARLVVTGEGHSFGHNKRGNSDTIKELGVDNRFLNRIDNISSTAIRSAIMAGRMSEAATLLGGGYLVELPVTDTHKLMPARGVYRILCSDGTTQREVHIESGIAQGVPQGAIYILSEAGDIEYS